MATPLHDTTSPRIRFPERWRNRVPAFAQQMRLQKPLNCDQRISSRQPPSPERRVVPPLTAGETLPSATPASRGDPLAAGEPAFEYLPLNTGSYGVVWI